MASEITRAAHVLCWKSVWSWRDKRTYWSCREPMLSSEHPHGSSQPPATQVSGDQYCLLVSVGSCTHVVHIQTSDCACLYTHTHTHTIGKNPRHLLTNQLFNQPIREEPFESTVILITIKSLLGPTITSNIKLTRVKFFS